MPSIRRPQLYASDPPVDFGGRLSEATRLSGLSGGQLKAKLLRRLGQIDVDAELNDPSLPMILLIAQILFVDPRWLATGIISPAAAAALESLDSAMKRLVTIGQADLMKLRRLLTVTTVEPDRGAGVCRYCGCTDAVSCGGCWWVDNAATICSECLLSGDQD